MSLEGEVIMPPQPKRQRKETQARIDAARREGYRMGYEEGLDAGRPPMIGMVIWSAICGLLGAAAGATLF